MRLVLLSLALAFGATIAAPTMEMEILAQKSVQYQVRSSYQY
jgi:hypothetical protein